MAWLLLIPYLVAAYFTGRQLKRTVFGHSWGNRENGDYAAMVIGGLVWPMILFMWLASKVGRVLFGGDQ